MKAAPIVIERTFNAPTEKVWKAITDNNVMKNWYFQLEEFKPEIGYKFEFYGGDENQQFLHFCEVTDVIPMKKLQYSWRYENIPGISYVTMELDPEDNKTNFKLTHEGVESFGGQGLLARESFVQGWTEIIGTSLREYLE